MKKIKMQTKIIQSGQVIEETYEIDSSVSEKAYAENLINNFNATLRPKESPRELLDVTVLAENGESRKEHSWEKQNLVTIRRAGQLYDTYKCTCCGITAKRYGVGQIVHDKRYSAEKYKYCK
jgi:hypothetical protein